LEGRASRAGEHGEDRPFARDLNLDQIVTAIAGGREERDLITRVLFAPLHDAGAVRYRQEVFQDLENPALFGQVETGPRTDPLLHPHPGRPGRGDPLRR
jgi:hypothetical protein